MEETGELITDNPAMQFKDIDHELYRTYIFFKEGEMCSVTITNPVALHVSASNGHRVLDSRGVSHYIPSGWIHLYWTVKDNVHFRF